jgi:hypothetical protein
MLSSIRLGILSLTVLIIHATGFSQFRNSGNLRIAEGGKLGIHGEFVNSASAVLLNDGQLHLSSHFQNDQDGMVAGNGTLYISGTSQQVFSGSRLIRTRNMNMNNNAGLLLSTNLHMAGQQQFVTGVISSSSTPNYLVFESGSSHTGASDASHVSGWTKKTGGTNFEFPVGNGTYYRPVMVSDLSISSEFNVKYQQPTFMISQVTAPIHMVKSNEYWQVNQVSGGTARVTINWDNSRVRMDNIALTDIRVSRYSGTKWINAGGVASGDVTSTGSVTSSVLASFGSFTLGYETFPVPLTLISFTGERRNDQNKLSWITENEESVDRFELQRSADGDLFMPVAFLPARNLNGRQQYQHDDVVLMHDQVFFYRLRSLDVDGGYSYSNVIRLTDRSGGEGSFSVVNPAKGSLTLLNHSLPAQDYVLRLLSASGELILEEKIRLGNGGGRSMLLPSQIPAGIYIVELSWNGVQYRQRVLVVK